MARALCHAPSFHNECFQAALGKGTDLGQAKDPAEFSKIWGEISTDPLVPPSFIQYLKTEWIPVSEMWSSIARNDQHIFEEGDTNMLIEAYVILSF